MRELIERMEAKGENANLLELLKKKVSGSKIVRSTGSNLSNAPSGSSRSLVVLGDEIAGSGGTVPFRSEFTIATHFIPTGKAGDMLFDPKSYKELKRYLPKHETRGKLHGQKLKVYFT